MEMSRMATQEELTEVGMNKLQLTEHSTQDEINMFFNSRIPTLSEGMRVHEVLGHIALYIMALESQLEQ